jgi:flagellar FliL protein
MAKDAKPEAENVEAAPPKKSKKLLILVVLALVLLLGIGGGAAFLLTRGHANQEGEDSDVVAENAKSGKPKGAKEAPPVYVALDAFTVNLVPENGDQFLQLIIAVEVADLRVGDRLKMYTPKLRNNVMMLLSGKKAAELITKDGKETLANEIRDLINEILDSGSTGQAGEPPVREVLFTSFIIQ